jgi:cell surface protein SprA
VDLTLTHTFSKSHSELYADTSVTHNGPFEHLNPYETGSFNMTYISTASMLKYSGVNSSFYNAFLSGRLIVSRRLGAINPYTAGLPDPQNPGYTKGYGPFSQDVLIPSFIAAYTGKDASNTPLIQYDHNKIEDNPFKYFIPAPNWKVTYNGLSKLPFFSRVMNNFVVNHGYTGTLAMNSFNSSLFFNDLFGLGFPSFIDSISRNYIPFFQVPNVTITQAFNPLIGFDAAFKNNLTAKFEIRKSKMESLSLIDYQVGENASTEYVIGAGFRKKGVRLPFPVFGVRRLKNELIFKADVGLRDDKSSNTFLANNVSVTSRGQKVIRVSPSIDYSVNDNLTLHFFFDRQQTIPYVSNAYPTTTTRAGLTLRFIFAR